MSAHKVSIELTGMTKTQSFHQDLYGYDLFVYPPRLRQHFSDIT